MSHSSPIAHPSLVPFGVSEPQMVTTSAWILARSCQSRYGAAVRSQRNCSRPGCEKFAAATLTYVYADSTAVIGPLAISPEPHGYDLCEIHAQQMTTPRGWELVRHNAEFAVPPPSDDDLAALADAVREAARAPVVVNDSGSEGGTVSTRRRHLRALPTPPSWSALS